MVLNALKAMSAGTGGCVASHCFVAEYESVPRERFVKTTEQFTQVDGASTVTAWCSHNVNQSVHRSRAEQFTRTDSVESQDRLAGTASFQPSFYG